MPSSPTEARADAIQAGVDERTLTALTNRHDPSAAEPDAAVLQATGADAIDRFALLTGLAYDASQSWHVGAGVDLTLSLLHLRAGNLDAAKAHRDAAEPALSRARKAAANAPPQASADADEDRDFADEHWRGYAPR